MRSNPMNHLMHEELLLSSMHQAANVILSKVMAPTPWRRKSIVIMDLTAGVFPT
jgi:hypothetical protein